MLTERERAIRDFLMDQVGGRPSVVDARKGSDAIDTDYLEMASRSMLVNKRRMIIFTVLFACVLLTALATMLMTGGNRNVILWVVVGAFNAGNAAVHYAAYQKKRMAMALFHVLEQEGEGG